MNTRKTFGLLALLICIVACQAADKPKKKENHSKETPVCAEWKMPEDSIYRQLGRKLTSILMNPSEVKVYSVAWLDTVTPYQLEPHFAQDSLLCKLSKEETAILQYNLISNPPSYEDNKLKVMSPYVPVLDFEFKKKKEVAHVVISLSDFSWSVLYDDKKQFTHNINSESIERFCKYYISKNK